MTMYVVGLTGGIGSGKTTIAAIFAELGAEIINADLLARNVVSPGTKALTSIAKRFGKEILRQDGSLDRRKLREVVFKNKGELKWLEKLIHPLIAELLIQNIYSATSPYVILESPLLIETQQKELVDRILVVDLDEATQLNRSMERDGSSEEVIRAIISAQIPRSKRLKAADDIVDNSKSLAEVRQKVIQLHEIYLATARKL
tara:strand:- start:410 stop:1015 length:606 start_codon:yes stop_codon:yes gene_type:complete